jgi:hypothetical protein
MTSPSKHCRISLEQNDDFVDDGVRANNDDPSLEKDANEISHHTAPASLSALASATKSTLNTSQEQGVPR